MSSPAPPENHPTVVERAVRSVKTVAIDLWEEAWSLRWAFLITTLVTVAVVYILFPHDPELLNKLRANETSTNRWAEVVSEIGKFEYSSLALAIVIGLIGMWRKSPRLRAAAMAALIAGIIGGVAVNLFRPTLGRARPFAEAENGLYYFEGDHAFQSLPSGHVASTSATLTALAVVVPVLAIPAAAGVATMAWARMQLERHYLSDVIAGAALGGFVGVVVGRTFRRRGLVEKDSVPAGPDPDSKSAPGGPRKVDP